MSEPGPGYRLLTSADAEWRPSNLRGILNSDLGRQLGASELGMRLWRIRPGQASTRQFFNDTAADALWLIVGAPLEQLETSPEVLAHVYPDGPHALTAELRDEV